MSKTWAKITSNVNKIPDFQTIMSEQMAVKLQLEQDIKLNNDEEEAKRLSLLLNDEIDTTAEDFELAKKMQEQFDKEELDYFDNVKVAGLDIENEKLNLDNEFALEIDSSSDDSESEEFKREFDSFEKAENRQLGKYEKHDLTQCGRMNACKTMNMNIDTGDVGKPGYDMKLNNNVYNSLKTHVKKERKRFARLNEKNEKSTAESVLDKRSMMVLFKLINAEIIDEVNGIISTGKESNVYHGVGANYDKKIDTGEVAIKIFKTSLNEFKNRSDYIKNDYRFNDRLSKSNSRQTIKIWAEKELNNYNRIRKAGILCPNVVILKKHILVLEFLGSNGVASPTLREAIHLNETQLERAKIETVDIIKNLFNKCDLIHADFSEYNLIYHQGRVYVIDVGQSVLKGHPYAFKFLLRDCNNISKFFSSRGLNMISGAELFCEITGINKNLVNCADDVEVLQKIQDIEKDNQFFSRDLNDKKKDDLFDEMFNKSLTERESNLDHKMSIKNSCIE